MSNIQTELESLKSRAKQMGLKFHPNIGLEKIKALVNSELPTEEVISVDPTKETRVQRIVRLRKDAHKLVRVMISCNNPDKKEYEGEQFTAGNGAIGSVTKYVPFNNDEGWHVPQIVLNMIRERKCQVFSWTTVNGRKVKKGKQIKEFNITILDPLTLEELDDLKERQAIAQTIDK